MQCITHRSPLCTPAGEEQRQGVRLRVRSRVRPRVRLRVRPGPPMRARSVVGEPAPVCRILEAGHHTPNLGPREAAHTVLANRTAPVMEVPRVNTDVAPRWRPRRPGWPRSPRFRVQLRAKVWVKTNCHNQETVANQSRIGVAKLCSAGSNFGLAKRIIGQFRVSWWHEAVGELATIRRSNHLQFGRHHCPIEADVGEVGRPLPNCN